MSVDRFADGCVLVQQFVGASEGFDSADDLLHVLDELVIYAQEKGVALQVEVVR